ncbi:MAG: serine/threonine-protein kinase [Gammaproteobacteria bacterium]|nr:serine/threonine-protein kinase [Gammaproteobacteria bacterium]
MSLPEHIQWISCDAHLGTGGQGNVHLVKSKSDPTKKLFALKILRRIQDSQALARFRQEIEIISQLDHPSIIKIHDFSEEDDEFQFYVMDYFEGAKTLAEILFQPSTNPYHGDTLKCLTLFEDIMVAIQAYELHDASIVHRDISPNNILLLPDGSIRLIDFGICQIEDGETVTLTGDHFGTRNYAPPECGPLDSTPVKIYTDIYSAAKVLWSAITSKRVFDREEKVFNETSMKSMFPNKMETWHLNRIFQKTIRQNPNDRHSKSEEVLFQISDVKRLVRGGYPPHEVAHLFCPACGQQQLGRFDDPYFIFGNPSRSNASPSECKACGFVFVYNYDLVSARSKELKNLR